MTRLARAAAALTAALTLAACAVGPNFKPSATPPLAAEPFVGAEKQGAVTEAPLPPHWWRLYPDSTLDALVLQALKENESLKTAEANLLYAQALLSEARDNRFPTTDLTASAGYGRSQIQDALAEPASRFFSAGFAATYQLDIFGRIRRGIEAARANVRAVQAAEDVARVTVAAETAAAYANVCGYGEQIEVAQQSIAVIQKSYDLTLVQRDAGALSDFDLARERALLEQTKATLPPLEGQRRTNLFILAALIGKTPHEIPDGTLRCAAPLKLDKPIPIGDGAGLIRRRPDLRQAEATLAADTARIGVATADLYPTISLGGNYTAYALTPAGLGNLNNASYSIGPLLNWSFPNISIARDHIKEASAQARADLATFDGDVLSALSDAEQTLATYAAEIDHNRALHAAQAASQQAYGLSRVQYGAGAYSFLDLLTVQQTLVAANQAAAASDTILVADQIALFQALGGGWEDAPPVTVPPAPR